MKPPRIKTTQHTANCSTCTAREHSLFSDFTPEDFALIDAPIESFQFPAGTLIYRQGDKVSGVYSLKSGMVKLNRINPDGTQRILRILRPGDVIGLEGSLSTHYENDAIALTLVYACHIPIDVITHLDKASPRLHHKLMCKWHDTLKESDTWFTELTVGVARVRMARLLLKMRTTPQSKISILFSLEDIGSVLGMTIETASRTLNAFLKEGIIQRIEGSERHYQIKAELLLKETNTP